MAVGLNRGGAMPEFNAEILLQIGFVDVASWRRGAEAPRLEYHFHEHNADIGEACFRASNVLYAFVANEDVKYIGKTTKSARTRFIGYRTPSERQITNWKCNRAINEILAQNGEVRIYIFAPDSQLRYGEFSINLAAGLEDALVARFSPLWNGKATEGAAITETAELEETTLPEDAVEEPRPPAEQIPLDPPRFQITLSATYYNYGMINPGVDASQYLGGHGEPITVSFSDGAAEINSFINRTANRTGAVRIIGANTQISAWFRQHFHEGDVVEVEILGPNHILMLAHTDDA
jgi:hypothetical protein